MSLNLENLPAAPVTRGKAPKLMTARRRRLWLAIVVVVALAIAARVALWRYQPLVEGPTFGPVTGDTEIWHSSAADVFAAEYRDGARFSFAFSLQNTGRLDVTIEELFPGHREWCLFNPTAVEAVVGGDNAVFDGSGTPRSLPVTVHPGEYVNLAVDGRFGGGSASPCSQAPGSMLSFDTVPARIHVGWSTSTADLQLPSRLATGRDVERQLMPSSTN